MIVPIVEGKSEIEAVPILLRRYGLSVAKPIRVGRQKVVKQGELEKAVQLAVRLYWDATAVLVVLDADDDCPAALGPSLLSRVESTLQPGLIASVVLPCSEFESWFIASIESLRGRRGVSSAAESPSFPEEIRDAKGWLSNVMTNRYVEVVDQPAFAATFDFVQALRCRSFQKFEKEIRKIASIQ